MKEGFAMLTSEDYVKLLKEGYIEKEMEVGGQVFTVRLLNTEDILVSDMVVDYLMTNVRSFASVYAASLEVVARLAFIIQSIDGKLFEPALESTAIKSLIDKLLDGTLDENSKREFINKYVKPKIDKLLKMHPSVIEIITEKYNKLREEVTEFIKNGGGLPN